MEWLKVCMKLRSPGMPLPEIRRYAQLVLAGAGHEAERFEILRRHEAKVQQQVADLQEALDIIHRKVELYAQAFSAGSTGSSARRGHQCPGTLPQARHARNSGRLWHARHHRRHERRRSAALHRPGHAQRARSPRPAHHQSKSASGPGQLMFPGALTEQRPDPGLDRVQPGLDAGTHYQPDQQTGTRQRARRIPRTRQGWLGDEPRRHSRFPHQPAHRPYLRQRGTGNQQLTGSGNILLHRDEVRHAGRVP